MHEHPTKTEGEWAAIDAMRAEAEEEREEFERWLHQPSEWP